MGLLKQSETISKKANIVVALGMLCGLREAEMCGLRWNDYDADTGELHIRHNLNAPRLDNIDHSLYEVCIPCGKKYLVLDKLKTESSRQIRLSCQSTSKAFPQPAHMVRELPSAISSGLSWTLIHPFP